MAEYHPYHIRVLHGLEALGLGGEVALYPHAYDRSFHRLLVWPARIAAPPKANESVPRQPKRRSEIWSGHLAVRLPPSSQSEILP